MRTPSPTPVAASALLALASALCHAQAGDALRDAAQRAIASNPEVTARFNAYQAAVDAVDVGRGPYYPRVDLDARAGNSNDRITSRSEPTRSLNNNGVALQVRQTLWDGRATRSDVGRLEHERLARYFEFVDASEQTALEATRAYHDVLRFRRLVALAEDSYVQHKITYNQIQSRVRAGVGRGVDLEQVAARLALAESNLATESSNLYDVTARYQRVVGVAPAPSLAPPALLNSGLPATPGDAATQAVARSAAVSASIESLRAARSAAELRKSAFQPLVEARVRSGAGKNFDGVQDQKRDTTADVVLNWNLYNGGADRARVRQQADLVMQAADLRDKTCRDTRQTTLVAYNDIAKLAEQLRYLERNVSAIEKARDAYRQQFDINQRSLLDLLNAENELYTARRAQANAETDLGLAHARLQAALQQLTAQLGLRRVDADRAPADANWSAGDDAPTRCPAVLLEVAATDRALLDARAERMSGGASGGPRK